MMYRNKLPACCTHHTAREQKSQQQGKKLHILFTFLQKTAAFIHKIFKMFFEQEKPPGDCFQEAVYRQLAGS